MRAALLLLAGLLPWHAMAAEPPFRFIAPLNHAMPFSDFDKQQLTRGIVKDLSEAFADRLGRKVEFIAVPPRRVTQVLAAGGADGVCYVAREWIDGDFHWSPVLFDHVGVLAGRSDAPRVNSVAELAGQPVGTVYGYRYPQLEQTLGPRFVRDDAPSMLINLRKLAAGRTRYAMTEKITLEFHNKLNPRDGLKVALATAAYRTHCAFTRAHPLPLDRLDQIALDLVRDGSIERILTRYR